MLRETNAGVGVFLLIGALAAAIVVLAVLMGVSVRRQRREREHLLNVMRRQGENQNQNMDRLSHAVYDSLKQMASFSGEIDARMDALLRDNSEKLGEMRHAVGERLDKRLNESFRLVNGQLADVHRGMGEMREMAANVTDLKKTLGNVKTRGVWGEMQLHGILMQMFSPEQYIENAAIPEGSAMRVEYALKLPDREGGVTLLPLDSKFSQEDYLRLADAEASGDAALIERCTRALERAVLEQAKQISEKYVRPPQTTDFAVMFLPAEGLYAEVARISGLIERVQTKHRVLISGPSTLCALLTSLQMGFRSSELEKRSGEALELMESLRTELAHFQEGLARTRQRLDQAESELEGMETRLRRIGKKLR